MNKDEVQSVSTEATPNGVGQDDIARIAAWAREHSLRVLRKLPVLGPALWLMMSNQATRHTLLSECEWRLMPPLALDQMKLYLQDEKPVALATWARISPAVAERYRVSPHHLSPADWQSGDQIWLVDVITPFGGAEGVLKDLRENVFGGQVVHQLLPPIGGGVAGKVHTWVPLP